MNTNRKLGLRLFKIELLQCQGHNLQEKITNEERRVVFVSRSAYDDQCYARRYERRWQQDQTKT